MRTTLTLDEDVAAALRHLALATGRSWKEVVNEALRLGLARQRGEAVADEPYATEPFDPGAPYVTGVHSAHELLALAEGEGYR